MTLSFRRIELKRFSLDLWHKKEALIWIAALLFLAFSNPSDHHYTLCPLHNLGWDFCPGCGLGRSISYLFHLQFASSFQTHPLGIPAVIIIVHRILYILITPKPNF
jgi:hypothetical protein